MMAVWSAKISRVCWETAMWTSKRDFTKISRTLLLGRQRKAPPDADFSARFEAGRRHGAALAGCADAAGLPRRSVFGLLLDERVEGVHVDVILQ
jgi:hypothetical protein